MSELTLTDMFCGAGGSSTGAIMVPGVKVVTAMNHWARAIETHNTNHPDTDHVQADISQTDPRRIARTTMLWGSPECTNHSVAKGKKRVTNQPDIFGDTIADEAADRSRATMWDMVRYVEHHNYEVFFTENVVDARRWIFFDEWLSCFHKMGYNTHIVYMNSMHAQYGGLPAPQSRDRMYVVGWKKGNKAPDFDRLRPQAYCPGCDKMVTAMQVFKKTERWGRYKAQYNWRCPNASCRNQIIEPGWLPAAYAIDWSLKGERIGDRSKPLAEKTLARIRAGLEKYGPVRLAVDAVRGAQILTPVDTEPHRTQTTSYTRGLLVPVEGRVGKEAASVMNALRTQTTRNETALLMPYYGSSNAQPVSDPIGTLTTVDRYAMITLRGQNAPKDISDPMDTFAANGNHHAVMGIKPPAIEDCTFRMLEPYEVTWGMAFPRDYIMTGNKREQVKQAGNAVTPPAARDLVACAVESLS
jgi:DNA (cytosine-5)-methyltransferase 1